MRRLAVLALAALAGSACSPAASAEADDVSALIDRLDLTSFPNSVGPRRVAGKSTFADYGFTAIERSHRGAVLTTEDRGWMMEFEVVSDDRQSLQLCFHDRGLQRPGDIFGPTYDATSALRVTKSPDGPWTAAQVRGGFAGCRNDPPTA